MTYGCGLALGMALGKQLHELFWKGISLPRFSACPLMKRNGIPSFEYRLKRLIAYVNNLVYRLTSGIFSFNTLVAAVLFIQGLRKVIFQQQVPSGPQMIWWSLRLLKGGC